jgi:hypothetical protein
MKEISRSILTNDFERLFNLTLTFLNLKKGSKISRFETLKKTLKNKWALYLRVLRFELKVVDIGGSSAGDHRQYPAFRRTQNEAQE